MYYGCPWFDSQQYLSKLFKKRLFPIVDFSLKDLWISATEAMVELVRIKLFQARKGIELSDHIKVLL